MSGGASSRLRPWQKLLLGLGLIWAMLVIAPDVYRLFEPLGSLGLYADNSGKIYEVDDDTAAARAGVTGGDGGDVIAIKSAPCWRPTSRACQDMLAVFGGMGGLDFVTIGTTVTLPIVRHDKPKAAPAPVTIGPAAVAPQDWPGKLFLALDEIVGIFVIWRTFQLAWTQPSPMTAGFFLYMMWFNPGQYFVLYAHLQHYPAILLVQELLQAMAQGAGYAGFLIFALRFPHATGEKSLRGMEIAAIGLGAVLAVLQLLSFGSVFGIKTEIVTQCAILGGYAVSFFAIYIVWLRRKQSSALDFQRMQWVLWGCAIGIPAFILADSNEATTFWRGTWLDLSDSEDAIEFFFLVSGVTALFISEAIRKRRVISVSLALRRFLVSILVVLLVVALEKMFDGLAGDAMHRMFASHPLLIWPASIVPVIPIAMSHEAIERVADRMLNQRYHSQAIALEQWARSLMGLSTAEEIDAAVTMGPLEAMQLASAALYCNEDDQFHLTCGTPHWQPSELHLAGIFDGACLHELRAGRPQRLRLNAHHASDPRADLAAPALAVPIMVGTSLDAVALYGPHLSGEDIDPMEIELLQKFSDAATLAYEAAQLTELKKMIQKLTGVPPVKKRRPRGRIVSAGAGPQKT